VLNEQESYNELLDQFSPELDQIAANTAILDNEHNLNEASFSTLQPAH
jgi:hypothetical protein